MPTTKFSGSRLLEGTKIVMDGLSGKVTEPDEGTLGAIHGKFEGMSPTDAVRFMQLGKLILEVPGVLTAGCFLNNSAGVFRVTGPMERQERI